MNLGVKGRNPRPIEVTIIVIGYFARDFPVIVICLSVRDVIPVIVICLSVRDVIPVIVICLSVRDVIPVIVICLSVRDVIPVIVICLSVRDVIPVIVICLSVRDVIPVIVLYLSVRDCTYRAIVIFKIARASVPAIVIFIAPDFIVLLRDDNFAGTFVEVIVIGRREGEINLPVIFIYVARDFVSQGSQGVELGSTGSATDLTIGHAELRRRYAKRSFALRASGIHVDVVCLVGLDDSTAKYCPFQTIVQRVQIDPMPISLRHHGYLGCQDTGQGDLCARPAMPPDCRLQGDQCIAQ